MIAIRAGLSAVTVETTSPAVIEFSWQDLEAFEYSDVLFYTSKPPPESPPPASE